MKGFGMEVSGRVTFSRNQAETTYCRESNGVCVWSCHCKLMVLGLSRSFVILYLYG